MKVQVFLLFLLIGASLCNPVVPSTQNPDVEGSGQESITEEMFRLVRSLVEGSGEEVQKRSVEGLVEEPVIESSGAEVDIEKATVAVEESSGEEVKPEETAQEAAIESSGEQIDQSAVKRSFDAYGYESSGEDVYKQAVNENAYESSGEGIYKRNVDEDGDMIAVESSGEEIAEVFGETEDGYASDILTRATAGNATEEGECKAQDVCFADKDCGGKGRCLGFFVGKCNCNACMNFRTCEDDAACGGLKGSCNGTTSRCDCFEGYKNNGFPQFIDALRELCNTKDCDGKGDTCFGLPCNSGRCVC